MESSAWYQAKDPAQKKLPQMARSGLSYQRPRVLHLNNLPMVPSADSPPKRLGDSPARPDQTIPNDSIEQHGISK
jgi:hypothetical protein